jgi:hypothetical protein
MSASWYFEAINVYRNTSVAVWRLINRIYLWGISKNIIFSKTQDSKGEQPAFRLPQHKVPQDDIIESTCHQK